MLFAYFILKIYVSIETSIFLIFTLFAFSNYNMHTIYTQYTNLCFSIKKVTKYPSYISTNVFKLLYVNSFKLFISPLAFINILFYFTIDLHIYLQSYCIFTNLFIISISSILLIPKHFLPKSFIEAPQ